MDNGNTSNTPVEPIQPISTLPPQAPPPSQQSPEQAVVGFPNAKKSKTFAIFIGLSVVVLLAVWGIVGYLYLENQKIENEQVASTEGTPTISPTPTFSPSEIKIVNGSVSRVAASGETTTLVNKNDYPETGIIGFLRVVVSPSQTKLCFESLSPAREPGVYISNLDGTEVSKISENKHSCIWDAGSLNVAYVNSRLSDPAIDIYRYDLVSKSETNLTADKQTTNEIRQYSLTQNDEGTLTCKYDVVNKTGQKLSEETCSLDIVNGIVTNNAQDE